MTLLIVYIGVALGFSFLCSVLEAVLLSVTPAYVARLGQDRPRVGGLLRELKIRVERPLAAILSLNTVAHTIGAAGVGAEAQRLWGSQVLAVTSAVLTVLILVLSEIIPKTLGAIYWRRLAPPSALLLKWLIIALWPLVWLSERITQNLKQTAKSKDTISREEIAALAHLGHEQGVVGESESRILRTLLQASSLRTKDIMTPRTVMFSLHTETTVREAMERRESQVFSRVPVWQSHADDIAGYVLKDDLLLYAARGEDSREVGTFVRDLSVAPELTPVPVLFETLLNKREQMALVVDEYGGVAGVVTMEDVVETLLGMEIVDEADTVQDMREMARARWKERAKRLGSSAPPPPGMQDAGETDLAVDHPRSGD